MNAVKFELSGKTAFFKKPDVNSYMYFTYSNIHKIAVLGMLGSILGLEGYAFQQNKDYPDFYSKLSDALVSIVPKNKEGFIPKKVQTFNNSVGYASKEQGGNLIVKEQWLENPKWDIYIALNDSMYAKELKDRLLNNRYEYIPYLGKNDHPASINNVQVVTLEKRDGSSKIDSLYIKKHFKIQDPNKSNRLSLIKKAKLGDFNESMWKYEEKLPVRLEKTSNQYEFEHFIFTNMEVESQDSYKLYSHNDKVLFFF